MIHDIDDIVVGELEQLPETRSVKRLKDNATRIHFRPERRLRVDMILIYGHLGGPEAIE